MFAKLDIYRKFTNALAVAVIVSVGWICYEVILSNIAKSDLLPTSLALQLHSAVSFLSSMKTILSENIIQL